MAQIAARNWRSRACVASLLLSIGIPVDDCRSQAGATAGQSGSLSGVVVGAESDVALPYSLVAVVGMAGERFTREDGSFFLADLPGASYRLRIRHIGYSPAETTLIVRPGVTEVVRIRLHHVAVRLATVRVSGDARCVVPGPPSARVDPEFAAIFEQLRQNADQFRLLSETYPFAYAMERVLGARLANGEERIGGIDTIVYRSDTVANHGYRPGRIVTRGGGVRRLQNRDYQLALPTLLDLVNADFLRLHCFRFAGSDTAEAHPAVRIEFQASARLRSPDVDGSFVLDSATYQIRRMTLSLSRIPRGVRGLDAVGVTAWFYEALPSIPVLERVESANILEAPRGARAVAAWTERQQLIDVRFLNRVPGTNGQSLPR